MTHADLQRIIDRTDAKARRAVITGYLLNIVVAQMRELATLDKWTPSQEQDWAELEAMAKRSDR